MKESSSINRPLVGIVDYDSCNLGSIVKAFKFIKIDTVIVREAGSTMGITHLILPGVGAFPNAMRSLLNCPAFDEIETLVKFQNLPILGICVGMQILFEVGYESHETKGLGWLKGEVVKLNEYQGLSVPHSGWNSLRLDRFFEDGMSREFYFDHSYHCLYNGNGFRSTVEYGSEILAFVRENNIMGCQFHPEKSGLDGLRLLLKFVYNA